MNFKLFEQFNGEEDETPQTKEGKYAAEVGDLLDRFNGYEQNHDQGERTMSKDEVIYFYDKYLSAENELGNKIIRDHIKRALEDASEIPVTDNEVEEYIQKLKLECEEQYSL